MPCPEKITQTTFLDIQFTAKDGVKFSEKDMFIKLSKKRRLVELTLLSDDLVITGIVANGKRTLLYPPVPLECVELEDKNCKGK